MPTEALYVLGLLALHVALSEWLVRHTLLRYLGSALLVICLTAISTNLGLLPSYEELKPVYAPLLGEVASLAIFLLLLQVKLADLRRAGGALVLLFLIGSFGTVCGVLLGVYFAGGIAVFGDEAAAIGGMFVGTYTGGSANFNAIALHYGVVESGGLYLGASVVDSAMTTLWMAATVLIPRLMLRRFSRAKDAKQELNESAGSSEEEDSETTHHLDLSLVLALGVLCVWASNRLSAQAEARGFEVPAVLILTTMALLLAQVPPVQRLRGTRVLGMFCVMLFLAVIGALCDMDALATLGDRGYRLGILCVTTVFCHGLIVFGAGALLRLDPVLSAVASQANIGGGTTALALARSLGRSDLVLPSILIGALGNALGTYLGFAVAGFLS